MQNNYILGEKNGGRSRKVKHEESEIDLIFSHQEGEENSKAGMHKNEMCVQTPSPADRIKDATTPRASQTVLQEFSQTPRRSCRKSIKPSQDYEDIVSKSMRFFTRSVKKNISATEEEQDENHINEMAAETKWTPDKVGRVSQKRSRKSNRTVIEKQMSEVKPLIEETIRDVKYIENDEIIEMFQQKCNISEPKSNKPEQNYTVEVNEGVLSDVKEMPSLIVCDDDEDKDFKLCDKFNEKFVGNGLVDIAETSSKHADDVMLSDDGGETPQKRVRIVVTDTELQDKSILSTPKTPVITTKFTYTPKLLETPKFTSSSKQKTEAFRFLTLRIGQNFKFNNENIKMTPSKHISNATAITVTTLEPKEIVLRGIRKRSLSVCIDNNDRIRQKLLGGPTVKAKQERIVSSNSPANQPADIDDLDALIVESIQKRKPQEKELSYELVKLRRKRSISLDESIMDASLSSKLPRPVAIQNIANKSQTSTFMSKPISRTKIPNFAAIHQNQFKKMENLVDHVTRKQERSKNLINSAIKTKKTASSQKKESPTKNNNISDGKKPKALKKINLGISTQTCKSIHNLTTASIEVSESERIRNLPDPRVPVAKPTKHAPIFRKPLQQLNQQQQIINKCSKPSQVTNIDNPRLKFKTVLPSKPAFPLSTSVMVKLTASSNSLERANTTQLGNEDKMASRLHRHMDLFKGRMPSTSIATASRRIEVILKGVRSNRRFELQMQYRKILKK